MIKQKNLDVDKQKLIQNVLQNFGAFVRLKNAKERRYARALSHVLENKPVQQQLQEQLEQLEAKKKNEQTLLEHDKLEEQERQKDYDRRLAAWEKKSEKPDLLLLEKLGNSKKDLEVRDQKINKEEEDLRKIQEKIQVVKEELEFPKVFRLPELKQSVQIDVPSLPSFLFDFLSTKFTESQIQGLTLDAFIYKLVATLWTDVKRGQVDINRISFLYHTFQKNPYVVDRLLFHGEAKNKADLLTQVFKDHQLEVRLDPRFAKAFLNAYDSLRQQISAYYTVLGMLAQSGISGEYWDTKKIPYLENILDLPKNEESDFIRQLETIAHAPAAKVEETKTISFIKNMDWQKLFFD